MNVQKLFLLSLFCLIISAGTVFSQKVRKVEIVNAETLEYDSRIGNGAKRLKDNVVFKHEDAYMYCDSAYHYASSNTVKAYNNVRIEQGDSLSMSGDIMRYEGEIKMAFVRNNVVLTHYDSYLETDSLNFDRTINMGYYFDGGNIYDGDNHLFSLRGYYYADNKDYYAVDDVVFTNPQYKIYCDTLRYNTGTGISYFYGPTTIVSDSNTIYCENGYYDTRKDLASFSENASLHSDKQILKGDSLFYDRNLRYGKAFNNVSIEDTVENAIAYGNYGIYYEDPQKAMLTDSVLFVYINEDDTLFMHSDTIFIDIDSADNKLIRAFHKVQVFRDDIQARCDSLIYNSADSISEMFGKPVVWSEESQLSGEKMIMHFEDGKAHHVEITGYALIVQEEDIEYYNQIQGRRLVAYLRDSDVYKVEIYNDSQTIYFIRDDETEELSGMNKTLCTDMIIYRENKQVERIKFFQKPDGVITPMDQLNNADAFLKDFKWYDKFRPKTKDDIFIWQEID